jgi:hypothetical protein
LKYWRNDIKKSWGLKLKGKIDRARKRAAEMRQKKLYNGEFDPGSG